MNTEQVKNYIFETFYAIGQDVYYVDTDELVKFGKNKVGYYQKHVTISRNEYVKLSKHRIIYCLEHGILSNEFYIDHKDHDITNNHPDNLRLCTQSQNQCNAKKRKNCTSIYKGVCVNSEQPGYWKCAIKKDNKYIWIGSFKDEIKAAKAYDDYARRLFGEFAKTNFTN